MGCAASVPTPVGPSDAPAIPAILPNSASIDKRLRVEAEESRRLIKCLLLGTGECGKSTIMKQMKILHGQGFNTEEDKETFRILITRNTLDSILSLCQAVNSLNIPWDSDEQKKQADEVITFAEGFLYSSTPLLHCAAPSSSPPSSSSAGFQSRRLARPPLRTPRGTDGGSSDPLPPSPLPSSSPISPSTVFSYAMNIAVTSGTVPPSIQSLIASLYQCAPVQRALVRANEFQILDSAQYFLNHSLRVLAPAYTPTTQDILRSRLPTTGIIEASFKVERLQFRMYDVGGQRGERKKWIHCFDGVTAILFVASLSEYDQVLSEERTRNRMTESLDLFEGINQLPWFRDIPVILFLNKADLFQLKVKQVDIGTYFPQYTGGNDPQAGLRFIQDEFLRRNNNPDKSIYCHVTDATNTENIAFVWKATKQIILEQSLSRNGMMM